MFRMHATEQQHTPHGGACGHAGGGAMDFDLFGARLCEMLIIDT